MNTVLIKYFSTNTCGWVLPYVPTSINLLSNISCLQILNCSINLGVIFRDSEGKSHKRFGPNILSAGAIGTPQLLLSGVGPTESLSSSQILIVHPKTYVGKFMIDEHETTSKSCASISTKTNISTGHCNCKRVLHRVIL